MATTTCGGHDSGAMCFMQHPARRAAGGGRRGASRPTFDIPPHCCPDTAGCGAPRGPRRASSAVRMHENRAAGAGSSGGRATPAPGQADLLMFRTAGGAVFRRCRARLGTEAPHSPATWTVVIRPTKGITHAHRTDSATRGCGQAGERERGPGRVRLGRRPTAPKLVCFAELAFERFYPQRPAGADVRGWPSPCPARPPTRSSARRASSAWSSCSTSSSATATGPSTARRSSTPTARCSA